MLSVLDGAVLVISAVEGVQAQTRVLMRTLQRLRIPTLIFVNKIDRARRARTTRVLHGIAEKLTPAVVAMGSARDLGTAQRRLHAVRRRRRGVRRAPRRGRSPTTTMRYSPPMSTTRRVPYAPLRNAARGADGRALVHPVFFGSAITGAGVEALMRSDRRTAARGRRRRRRPRLGRGVQGRPGAGR